MLSLEKISYGIQHKTLLRELSLSFEKGKMHIILGPNGAGKSTLIKLISGELKPTQGNILFENQNLHHITLKEQARFRAVLSQNIELGFPMRVQEVVLMGRYPHFDGKPRPVDFEICDKAMQVFHLSEMKDRNYLTLSGGEKQRVQCARVFAQIWEPVEGKSRLLLLDEPLTFLDIFYQYDLMQKIKDFMQVHSDLTVIGVIHDINIATKFSDQILLLKNAEVFEYGPASRILTPKNIFTVFNVWVKNTFEI